MKCPKCRRETPRLWGIDKNKPVCPDCYRQAGSPTLRGLETQRRKGKKVTL